MYLLDTNIISEISKIQKGKADQGVERWFYQTHPRHLFLNDIVLLELKQGALLTRYKGNFAHANALDAWIDNQIKSFGDRILPITQEICLTAATLHVPNQRDRHDALIAATALVHGFTVVTRNLKDFSGIDGLVIHNPFIDSV